MLSSMGLLTSDGRVDPMAAIRQRKAGLEAEADQAATTVVGVADLQQYWLRMCVYNGENLKFEVTQVIVEIGEGTAGAISIASPDHPKSRRPVWEFSFEQLIEISGDPPLCEIKVMGKSVYPHQIGAAALSLPKVPTDGPRRVWLPLKNVPSGLPGVLDPPASKIQVVWQLCSTTIGEPDLVRVAEMDTMATEKQRFEVQMRLLRVKLKHGRDPPANLRVKVDLLHKSEAGRDEEVGLNESKLIVAGQRVSEPVLLATSPNPGNASPTSTPPPSPSAPGKRRLSETDVEPDPPEAEWATWGRQGWSPEQFALRETQVNLLSYILQITVQIQEEKKFLNLCIWQETVGNLLDSIESRHQILRFDAEMHTMRGATVCAWARIEVDIHDGVAHKPPPPMLQDEEANPKLLRAKSFHANQRQRGSKAQEVPLRRGLLPESRARHARTVKYYCTVYLDGIPMEGMEDASDPFVSVVMGSSKASTPSVEDKSNDIFFAEPLLVSCQEAETKARIEVWNSNATLLPVVGNLQSLGLGALDTLIGEAMIYDVEPNKTYWRYLYGGAHNAPRQDQAMQMNKGAIQPASTYHGTVVVYFGTKPRAPAQFQENIKRAMSEYILTVRLYQGSYLHHYKGKAVTVLFQIAGCSLPVQPLRLRDDKHGWNSNPYLLAFPGTVSSDGVLTFIADSFADATTILKKSSHTEPPQWVQRSTPKEIRINGNSGDGPTHAYCYIVAVGAEDECPQTFGRFRLNIDADMESLDAPRWKRMRFDRSVVQLPKASFKNDLAGFLLGSVVIRPKSERSRQMLPLGNQVSNRPDSDQLAEDFSRGGSGSQALQALGQSASDLVALNGNRPAGISEEQLLPRTSKPKSVMCRPCTGETFIHVASQGDGVLSEEAGVKYLLYCHVDVLCARNLVATDPNGLSDPVFSIQVGNKSYRSSEMENTKTLNPTFMKRLCIPIEVSSEVERPPVLVKLFDYDSAFDGGGHLAEAFAWVTSKVAAQVGSAFGGEFVDVATVVVKADQTTDLDARGSIGKLDLDKQHTAYWHALDRHAFAEFDADEPGGCPPSFSQSPRILLAVGFSRRKEVTGTTFQWGHRRGSEEHASEATFARKSLAMLGLGGGSVNLADSGKHIGWANIETGRTASYKINLDLLGVRNLTVGGLDLHVTSFWSGSAFYNCGHEKNANFEETSILDDADTHSLLDLLHVEDTRGADVVVKKKTKGRRHGQILGPLVVPDFCGSRIVPPLYRVPVIGYLQKRDSSKRRSEEVEMLASGVFPEEERPFLLMPDVLFQLKTKFGHVYGSLSMSIPQRTYETWAITCMKKAKECEADAAGDAAKRNILKAERIKNPIVREDAYRVMVDCFASKTGYIKWNKEVMMGRGLTQQHIFSIYDTDGDGKFNEGDDKGPFTPHFFNPGDFMADNDKFSDEPFDERVCPILRCAELVGGQWLPTREKSSSGRPGYRPLNPEELYEEFKPFAEKALGGMDGAPAEGALPAMASHISSAVSTIAAVKTQCTTELGTATTMQLRNRTAVAGWRALSHLHAPEPIPFDKACRGQNLGCPSCPNKHVLDANLHTFIRPVGHRIDMRDRDSRFIARLRIGLPDTQKDKAKEEDCINFVIVKMDRPGVIIWAPPLDLYEFHSIRTPILFIVELTDGSRDIVPVSMPSFDLRFNFETMWYLRKTLVMRWQELRNRIERERVNKEKQKIKGETMAQSVPPPSKSPQPDADAASRDLEEGGDITFNEDQEDEDKLNDVEADFLPGNYFDGYSRSIYVTKNAFVCRFLKRMKGLNFDRPQTENWYRAILSTAFKEIEQLPIQNENDSPYVKNFFMERFMNMRKQLYLGVDHKDSGILKGHLSVEPVDVDDEVAMGASIEEVERVRPIENLWIKRMVTLNLYVLTARNLKLHGITSGPTFQPYLIIDIMGTDNVQETEAKEVSSQAAGVDFYTHYSASVGIPGATTLRIRLMQKRSLRKDLLMGETTIDIEDRVYCLLQTVVRQDVDLEYRAKYVQPQIPFQIEKPEKGAARNKGVGRTWTKAEPIRQQGLQNASAAYQEERLEPSHQFKLAPRLPPQPPAPIEAKALMRQDEDTSAEIPVGSLRFWLDMTPSDESYVEAQLQDTSQVEFRIIVTIWDVMNISIFKDYGERNDCYVQVVLTYRDINGKVESQAWKTSVHKWAHTEASFNERKSFKVKAPVMSCTMSLMLFDDDIISQDDLIYDSKVVSLDHMLMLAFTHAKEGKDPIGVNKDSIMFDSWPKNKEDMHLRTQLGQAGLSSARIKSKEKGPDPATMRYDVQVLPELEFNAMGLQDGVVAPQKGRLTWETAMQNPKRFLVALFGPSCVRRSMCGACLASVVLVLVIITMVMFFLSSSASNLTR